MKCVSRSETKHTWIGRLRVPKLLYALDGYAVPMTRSGCFFSRLISGVLTPTYGKLIVVLIVLLTLILLWERNAQANTPAIDELAVSALIGEAEGESYLAKLATAECLRNRLEKYGDFRGVYGLKSPRIHKASKAVRAECLKAWNESAHTNLVKGASVWGNAGDVEKFKKMKWFRNCVFVAQYGGHRFFREVQP